MPFETVYRCADCKMEFPATSRTHNCSQSTENKAARAAKHATWEERFDFVTATWGTWLERHHLCEVDGNPSVDNLPTDRAFEGRCVIFGLGWDDDKLYRTGILANPTWGRVFRKFLACMAITGDTHHSFLEGLEPVTGRPEKLRNLPADVTVLKFCTGS